MKPMLAGKVTDVKNIAYPVLCTPKLDGIRALMLNGVLVSRNLKRIPNKRTRELFEKLLPDDGVDGELILINGKPCGALFNETSSAVMMEDGEPDVVYHIFDWVDLGMTYRDRVRVLKRKLEATELFTWRVKLVLPIEVRNETELLVFEKKCLEDGFEGVMIRSVDGPYKEGRSTEREGYLLKLKRFEDAEARIIGLRNCRVMITMRRRIG